jgi:hypothetical protein
VNVENAGFAKPVLGRQSARDQVDVINEAGSELAAKTCDALRYENIIDPILYIGVLIADVKASRSC